MVRFGSCNDENVRAMVDPTGLATKRLLDLAQFAHDLLPTG